MERCRFLKSNRKKTGAKILQNTIFVNNKPMQQIHYYSRAFHNNYSSFSERMASYAVLWQVLLPPEPAQTKHTLWLEGGQALAPVLQDLPQALAVWAATGETKEAITGNATNDAIPTLLITSRRDIPLKSITMSSLKTKDKRGDSLKSIDRLPLIFKKKHYIPRQLYTLMNH